MKNLPNELQEEIVRRLPRKDQAKARAVSKDLKKAADRVAPPPGRYDAGTGRYQKRFGLKSHAMCARKQYEEHTGRTFSNHYYRFEDDFAGNYLFQEYKALKKAYGNNTLFKTFRDTTAHQSKRAFVDDAMGVFEQHYDPDFFSPEEIREASATFRREMGSQWKESMKIREMLRRRVTRLLSQWSAEDSSYVDALHLARRRTVPYTAEEEKAHKDKLMDAIIVQTAVLHGADDPTLPQRNQHGKLMSLSEKVQRVIKFCSSKK